MRESEFRAGELLIRKNFSRSDRIAAVSAGDIAVRVMAATLDRELYSDPFLNQKVKEFLCGGL